MKLYKPPNSRLITGEYKTNHDAASSRSLDSYLTSAHLPRSLFQPMCLLWAVKVIALKVYNRHSPPQQVKIAQVNISLLTFARASPLHKFQVKRNRAVVHYSNPPPAFSPFPKKKKKQHTNPHPHQIHTTLTLPPLTPTQIHTTL